MQTKNSAESEKVSSSESTEDSNSVVDAVKIPHVSDSETEEPSSESSTSRKKRKPDASPKPARKKRRIAEKKKPEKKEAQGGSKEDCIQILSSDDETDDLNEGLQMQSKKKRRKIRKIKDDQSNKEKEAQKREEERKNRLENRKKQKSETTSEESSESSVMPENRSEVCLNPDGEGQKVYAFEDIGKVLQTHQIEGIRFMFDNVVETVERARDPKKEGFGCILAHFMGLGKTLQCIALIEAYLSYKIGKHVLVVVPVNVIHNWNHEFEKWIPEEHRPPITVVYKSSYKERVKALQKWDKKGGVLIIGYEMFRNLIKSKRVPVKLQKQATKFLTETPSLLIIDEGHRIKNVKTGLSKVLNSVVTKRRIVLTGTPLQNNLTEYYCMVNFVRQDILGSEVTFNNRFKNPITNGQCSDSRDADIRLMKERVYILHKKLQGFVHRRDYSHMKTLLPSKSEFVLFCRLCPIQRQLYKKYLASLKMEPAGLFQSYHWLMKVWNHPDSLLHYERDEEERMAEYEDDDDSTGSLVDFIADSDDEDTEATRQDSDSDIELIEQSKKPQKRKQSNDGGRQAKRRKMNWWHDIVNEDKGYEECNVENSSKTIIAFRICELAVKRKEKVLLFSQSLFLLDLMEQVFQDKRGWKLGKHYMRLDGGTASKKRHEDIDYFNARTKAKPWVYLISTKAGSLGVNLHSANKVIVFDCSWNPSHDSQAIFRSYRQGQKNDVTIYRLVASGTMEQKIYQRQIMKKSLSLRVVDEKQIERYFDKNEVNQLYQLEDEGDGDDDDLLIPVQGNKKCRDEIMIQLLKEYGSAQCLEHLEDNPNKCTKAPLIKDIEIPEDRLQHQTEMELNKEEQLAAEKNFENALHLEASQSQVPFLDSQSGMLDNGEYHGRSTNYIGGGTGLVETVERVQCARCKEKTPVRITESTNQNTKYRCTNCGSFFKLALDPVMMNRLRNRLQKLKEREDDEEEKYREIMRLNDPQVFAEFHQALTSYGHGHPMEVNVPCPNPKCGKVNQFKVTSGNWNIKCGLCKQTFTHHVPQTQRIKKQARRKAIMDMYDKFILRRNPHYVDLTNDAPTFTSGMVDLTRDPVEFDPRVIRNNGPVDLTQDQPQPARRLDIMPPSLEICENIGVHPGAGSKEDAIVLD